MVGMKDGGDKTVQFTGGQQGASASQTQLRMEWLKLWDVQVETLNLEE